MLRKGVSPVVATVLLIVIVVVLAAIIFIWARGFLSESAVKGGRVVESSCEDVKFQIQIVKEASQCPDTNDPTRLWSAIDINNIGNIPIYGARILQFKDDEGSIDVFDSAFVGGTVKIGLSSYACLENLQRNVVAGDKFRVVPKLLAEKDERKIVYTCPEKDGITGVYT